MSNEIKEKKKELKEKKKQFKKLLKEVQIKEGAYRPFYKFWK